MANPSSSLSFFPCLPFGFWSKVASCRGRRCRRFPFGFAIFPALQRKELSFFSPFLEEEGVAEDLPAVGFPGRPGKDGPSSRLYLFFRPFRRFSLLGSATVALGRLEGDRRSFQKSPEWGRPVVVSSSSSEGAAKARRHRAGGVKRGLQQPHLQYLVNQAGEEGEEFKRGRGPGCFVLRRADLHRP